MVRTQSEFFSIWRQFQGKAHDDQLALCPIATQFDHKIEDIIFVPLGKNPTRGQIAQAKYMLQEEWHTWRKSVTAWHLRGATGQHRCVDDLYFAFFDQLHIIDLTARPPINLILEYETLIMPPPVVPQAAPPPLEIAGILLGELEDVADEQNNANT